MFDLTRDLDKYHGIPPYASELYGVFQPLLGWKSRLTKVWIRQGGPVIDPRVRKILDGNIAPGPENLDENFTRVRPLQAGHGLSPFTVLLTKDFQSYFLKLTRDRVQAFVDSHSGHLPGTKEEWGTVINIAQAVGDGPQAVGETDIQKTNAYHHARLWGTMPTEEFKQQFLSVMQYESQIAGFLLFYAEEGPGFEGKSKDLKKLFLVKRAPSLDELFGSEDPLAAIDPQSDAGTLSPVGFVHLFRQYFFDLGTFLGEPVEHIWLAPGTTIELIEVSTRRTLVERSLEESLEVATRNQNQTTNKDELSDAVKEQNQNSTKLGVSTTTSATYNSGVFVAQGTLSASFGSEATRSAARESAHRQVRELTEQMSAELKRNAKSLFRTVTETTDTTSRRHVIENKGPDLLNYELRRKMRRVGVQIQDIGQRLCWQVFVDDPGASLGLADLVHLTDLGDLANLKEPEKLPPALPVTKSVVVPLAYTPVRDYSNNRAQYEFEGMGPDGLFLGRIKGDEDDNDSQIVIEFRGFKFDPPQTGYTLASDIRLRGVQSNKLAVIREVKPDLAKGSFDIVMQRLNFGGDNVINLELELVFVPTVAEKQRIEDQNKSAHEKYDAERKELLRRTYIENVRRRIKDASNVRSRLPWHLREEERTVIYRELIKRLMLNPVEGQGNRLAHVRSEIIRALFDVDAMLYFVAPEWWMPRSMPNSISLNLNLGPTAAHDPAVTLTEADIVRYGGINARRSANYNITEDSSPARMGSSLGWLLQLDGDNLRNAFLNAPWVKAVIPIRPGRETAALNWLRNLEKHEDDGWDSDYLGGAPEDAEFAGKKVGEVLEIIAERLRNENSGIGQTLQSDKVFEKGFDPLAGGFDAGVDPNHVFSQFITVVPTDQIVAKEYVETSLMDPVH